MYHSEERNEERILVSPATAAGVKFLVMLNLRKLPCAALVNNDRERESMLQLGIEHIVQVNTSEKQNSVFPEFPVGKVFLFESSLALCCRYLQLCRSWTGRSIYVITQAQHSRLIFRGVGADYVIHTNGGDVSYLILDEAN
ncbi:hypothetical protein [Paenibacillus herberti]|uniref:RCK N-terminal domain-containing protein n=1 Tax=Paenibacillus herberti TaxID=1619309 RepID=A0A229P3J1_9BACL|nr:hypothetical protein [Paenibacillus herberti]OXM16813.1 hypothetical protein CGZ75_09215 [Paenibacillus herberti]